MKRFTEFLPRIILCAPGHWESVEQVHEALGTEGLEGIEFELQEADPRMVTAFDASRCPWEAPFADEEVEAIRKHTSVLYALSPEFESEDALRWCNTMCMLAGQLFVAGATGVKCDSCGITHPLASWKESFQHMESAMEMLEKDDPEQKAMGHAGLWVLAYRTFLQGPMWDGAQFLDCGMHLLGGAGTIVTDQVITQAFGSDNESRYSGVMELMEAFSLYQVVECDEGQLKSGDTFRADEDSPRFRVELEEDTYVEVDSYYHNPYGRWRFTEVVQ